MSSKTASYRLGDLTDWLSGGTPSKKNPEYWGDEIPWISASSMGGSRYSNSDLKITKLGLESGSRLALKGSILLLVRGSTLHNRIPVGIAVRDVAFNQDVKAIRVKPELAARQVTDEMYLYYWLKANEKKLLEMVEHTGIGAGKLDTKRLQDLEIRLPSWSEQRQIVASATAIDEKEILNSCINQTLEQMAQAIFKSWFVDFEPVKAKIAALEAGGSEEDALLAAMQAISAKDEIELARLQAEQPEQYAELRATAELFPSALQESELGEIPEGWEVYPILEVCDLLGGAQPPASTFSDEERPGYVRLLQIRDFTNDNHLTFVPDSKKLRKVSEDEVLIGRYGSASGNKEKDSLGRICRGKSGAYNVALMKLSPQKAGIEFCVQLFSSHDFYHYLRGTSTKAVQSGFSKKELKQYQVCLPSVGLREKYEALGQLIWSQQKRLTKQSKSLEQTRDTLLPKLLSGELSLTGAEQQLEATEPVNV